MSSLVLITGLGQANPRQSSVFSDMVKLSFVVNRCGYKIILTVAQTW
jgi:hypothetical protein